MSRPGPRVLLVTAEYAPTPGGLGDYTARLAEALRATGAELAILTSRRPPPSPAPLNPPNPGGTKADSLPARTTSPPALGGWGAESSPPPVWRLAPGWGWHMPSAVATAAAAWPADIVHIQYQTGAYAMHPAINLLPWWLRRRRARPRLVVTFHDTRPPYLFPKASRLRTGVTAALARGCDLTIATNPADAVWLRPHARRLALIPIGANIEPDAGTAAVAARLRAGLNLDRHERLLATFGLFNHSKGLTTLLQALARLNDPAGVGRYRLALVGAGDTGLDPTDRATAGELRRLATDLGIANDLIWTGHRPATEVAGWLRAADAVALPYADGASYRRGTLLAALACGAAIVTTTPALDAADEAAGLPPLRSGVQATLIPPDDPVALATALAATAGDQYLNAALRHSATILAARFTWPAIAARTLDEYRGMNSEFRVPSDLP